MRSREAGYSAVEMLVAIGLMGVVSSIAAIQIGQSRPSAKGDGAMRVIMGQFNLAREASITQRHQMQLQFIGTDQLQIVRQEVPAGTTVVSSVVFEGGVQYGLIDGIGDTPDSFGRNAAVDFGPAARILFNTDGSLIDQSGNPLNGTVFVSIPNMPRSQRAVTVLGGTGRVRAYRWDGRQWVIV